MVRQIIFKDAEGKEYTLNISEKDLSDVIWNMMVHFKITYKFSRTVITTSNDEFFVSAVLSNFRGSLTSKALFEVIERFPRSESIQLTVISYCKNVYCDHDVVLKKLQKDGISKKVKKEAELTLDL